ncbi:MAG: hypothetical protein H7Y22_11630, partial [Gemmatimonadaceae bacterium]|nr:hypothetical protein [Gloeobacterales cyanobacterium ES-bin-141]
LEPGRDGVGDYVRLLALECAKQGHTCSLIALEDPFLQSRSQIDNSPLSTLRISPQLGWPERTRQAQHFLEQVQPDWLSFHFVPYSFNSKGINYDLDKHLQPLFRGCKLHFMFHEVWIGENHRVRLKQRIIGMVQRYFIGRLICKLNPNVIHTSNPHYRDLLNQHRIQAQMLPMFGTIHNGGISGDSWVFTALKANGFGISSENRHKCILFGFFGTIQTHWPAEPLFQYLLELVQQYGYKIAVISVGHLRNGAAVWSRLVETYSSTLTFLRLDEQPTEKISELLNSLDFGISTTSFNIAGKSSTIAAMIEHGLPVVFNWDGEPWLLREGSPEPEEPLFWRVDDNFLSRVVNKRGRGPVYSGVQKIAMQFVHALQESREV